ncbi:hypothetical protein WH297_10840 [Ochrobactrum vermis]|uniref:TIGR02391 family protein n=1 Tax=Ochrobactrum vermis TaxID=1827297 RepID=A0ABU8PF67_9HYPH|nr:hypothetical protein [Ochrobactrum vermis]PQZ30584.1 hypothetical protein CQZ93_11000 [Ochrobactrum vermis]
MTEFNRMTVVAAAEVLGDFKSHNDMEVLEVQWDIVGKCNSSSKSGRVANLARIAIEDGLEVFTEAGRMPLARALIEAALRAPPKALKTDAWTKLVAGLRFDGFEVDEEVETEEVLRPWQRPSESTTRVLRRMMPEDLPGLDFREAENEVELLLTRHGFSVAQGHLRQAVSAFSRGEWSSANGALRNFYESYLNEIAVALGYNGSGDGKAKRDFLGTTQPPFLFDDYNEWNANNQKPQYVQGLMSRMHPHGGHPGLSEEEDATFRLQISLVTARLFLRRFNQRKLVP